MMTDIYTKLSFTWGHWIPSNLFTSRLFL